MLKIGDFSRLVGVPVKTLRYYDEIDLLKPEHVDAQTGYRFYTFEQLPRLNRLLALKDLGLSLDQVGQMLTEALSADQIRGMLLLKQAELEGQVQETRQRIARVESRLKLIETEDKMPDYDVVIKTVDPILVASRQESIPDVETIGSVMDRLFNEVVGYIIEHKGKFAGPGTAVWHDRLQAEATLPIEKELPESDRVTVRELPREQMACLVHHGSFDGFQKAYEAGHKWIQANGYQITGPSREVYLQFKPDGNPKDYVTELQFPVEKTEAA